jgi:hypothetical protein
MSVISLIPKKKSLPLPGAPGLTRFSTGPPAEQLLSNIIAYFPTLVKHPWETVSGGPESFLKETFNFIRTQLPSSLQALQAGDASVLRFFKLRPSLKRGTSNTQNVPCQHGLALTPLRANFRQRCPPSPGFSKECRP